jgi:AraC-like DNA-binding protein
MNPVLATCGYCLLAGAAISCYKALEQVLAKKTEEHDRMLMALLLCTGFLQVPLGLYFAGASGAVPGPLYLTGLIAFITVAYCAGPAAYLYYQSLISPVRGRALPHLAPAAAAGLLAAAYFLTRESSYRAALQEDFLRAPHGPAAYLLLAGAVAVIVGYTVTILAIEVSVRNSVRIRRAVRSLIAVTAGLLLSPVALLSGFLAGEVWLAAAGALFLAAGNILFIMAHVRYHDFFLYLGSEVRLARQKRSVLKGLDIPRLRARLAALMEEEHYYRNFDISMASTAERLSVTPHQLSCFLNRKMRIDFSNYINRHRVEEAKKLLAENPEQTVLTICYHVGFGSKTSFNVTFRDYTGMTPTQFREQTPGGRKPA